MMMTVAGRKYDSRNDFHPLSNRTQFSVGGAGEHERIFESSCEPFLAVDSRQMRSENLALSEV